MVKWRNCEAQAKGKVKGRHEIITKRSKKVDKKSYNFNLYLELALNLVENFKTCFSFIGLQVNRCFATTGSIF